jgi:murein DD-endopeptidase MepM/ murein hydrolase activator NlpD
MPRQQFRQAHQKVRRIGRLFLIMGLSLAGTLLLSIHQGSVALESTPTLASIGGWRGASFPVENFVSYTSPFGYRRSATGGYNQEFHRGLDMAAPQGSYVRNWWTGRVVEVSDSGACGTSVTVQSGDWQHVYCHMQGRVEQAEGQRYMIDRNGGIQVFEGQAIAAGARIGRVGMTGRTTGPHLHWGLKYSGQWVDPALVLRAMYAEQTASGSVSILPQQ